MPTDVIVHIIAGAIAFASSIYIIYKSLTVRYDHRIVGVVFVAGASVSAITGTILALPAGYTFLAVMSVLTLWQIVSGVAYAIYKNEFIRISKYLALTMLPFAAILIYGDSSAEVIIGSVYSIIAIHQVYLGYAAITSKEWLTQHIAMMIGAVITMATALLLRVNSDDNMNTLLWVLPTLLLSPLVYKLRFYPRDRKRL